MSCANYDIDKDENKPCHYDNNDVIVPYEGKETQIELTNELKKDEIISKFFIHTKTGNVVIEFNEKYDNRKIVFSIDSNNWNRFIQSAKKRLDSKKIGNGHIAHVLDTLDNNYESILDIENKHNDNVETGQVYDNTNPCNIFENGNDTNLSIEEWQQRLIERYSHLKQTVNRLIPELWGPLEFALSVKCILNIKDLTLPFAGVILGPPSSFKTATIELFRKYPNTFYTDSFSAKSFVSHNTSVPKEKLAEIDLIPKINGKLFLSPELSPTFSKREEELNELLGIVTRILDGHGYESDTGAQGHRGYNEGMMFVWVGAAVEIPRKVHKLLGTLGPKLYFYRMDLRKKNEEHYLNQLKDEYNDNGFKGKTAEIKKTLWDYLKWVSQCPVAERDSKGNCKVFWNGLMESCSSNGNDGITEENKIKSHNEKDDDNALRIIIRLSKLLACLRGVVPTWETRDSQGSDYAYTFPTIEEPDRAITQLKNLARGHALSHGRLSITMEDVPLLIRVVLSTASKERVIIFDYLLERKGLVETTNIEKHLMVTKPTALRTMTEFLVLRMVNKIELGESNNALIQYKLDEDFNWFLSEEFKNLRNNFGKEYHQEYIDEKLEREEKK